MTPGPKPRELSTDDHSALDQIAEARTRRDREDAALDTAILDAVARTIPAHHIADAAQHVIGNFRR